MTNISLLPKLTRVLSHFTPQTKCLCQTSVSSSPYHHHSPLSCHRCLSTRPHSPQTTSTPSGSSNGLQLTYLYQQGPNPPISSRPPNLSVHPHPPTQLFCLCHQKPLKHPHLKIPSIFPYLLVPNPQTYSRMPSLLQCLCPPIQQCRLYLMSSYPLISHHRLNPLTRRPEIM